MYGHEIVLIGKGFGLSLAFTHHLNGAVTPSLALFHSSDDFHQSLFSVTWGDDRPQISNVFDDRLREVLLVLRAEKLPTGSSVGKDTQE